MKRLMLLTAVIAVGGVVWSNWAQAKGPDKKLCTTIQDNVVEYSSGHYLEGETIKTGKDIFGYNYQAMSFDGSYANAYLGRDGLPPYDGDDDSYLSDNPSAESKWYWPYRETNLSMKWNDQWLSNLDCDNNGALDRHYGNSLYRDSGAWLTNHMRGVEDGEHWTYFTKIVATQDSATETNDVWYDKNGTEIGPEIWGEFAILQETNSKEGATYHSPSGPGFGQYKK